MITYTRQGAVDLRARLRQVSDVTDAQRAAFRVGTFHAECFRMMLQAGVPVQPILGQREQLHLFYRACQAVGLSGSQGAWELARIAALCRAAQQSVPRRFRSAMRRYEALKRRMGRWDFDDILERFAEKADVWLQRVPPIGYVLVDEFQDVNGAQWHILNQIVAHFSSRIFIVGDDDQSIYAFRGASPDWLLHSVHHFPNTEAAELAVNFRSDQEIVRASSRLIQHNRQRMSKSFRAHSMRSGFATVTIFRDVYQEAQAVARWLAAVVNSRPDAEAAVLARTRRQLEPCMVHTPPAVRHRVSWATFHGAKGREWDSVAVVGAVEGNPYLRASERTEEEERRLFYVAMTRARHALWVTVPGQAAGARMRPARFIDEAALFPSEEQEAVHRLLEALALGWDGRHPMR